HSGEKGPECFTINYVNLRTAAKLAREFVERWLKVIFAEENTRQLGGVELSAKRFSVNKRRAENFEWLGCAAAFGDVCAFEQTQTRIDRRGIECRHVWRRHDPRQAGLIEPHRALPIFHR